MGLPETHEYLARLKKAEKIREAREQRALSASTRQPINVGGVGHPTESLDNASSGEFKAEYSLYSHLSDTAHYHGSVTF